VIERIAHAFLDESPVKSTTAELWNRGRPGQQRNPFVNTQDGGGARCTVHLGEEAQIGLAGRRNPAGFEQKVREFGMFVRLASGMDARPQLSFLGADPAHMDTTVVCRRRPLQGQIEHVADFDGPVVAASDQVQSCRSGERTHFV